MTKKGINYLPYSIGASREFVIPNYQIVILKNGYNRG